MATRAEQWKQAAAARPRPFTLGEVTFEVTDQGTLRLSLDVVNPVHAQTTLDAFQAKKLSIWLRENFE